MFQMLNKSVVLDWNKPEHVLGKVTFSVFLALPFLCYNEYIREVFESDI